MEDLLKSLWGLAAQIVGGGAVLLIAIGAAEALRRQNEECKPSRSYRDCGLRGGDLWGAQASSENQSDGHFLAPR